ncbi:amidohydrolase family protein [Armatimonas rosea]|uniref:Putative TIM-barrel fold metal-dependent hydrolase n=1 Tax=Armatimonas rosea TaxID=685828 RepID=A0A7W9W8Z0_ARMRO|nr:amidohydrolase family protein [Armatimonas rosea]MBB6052756.1 putative TIM-barrel fold metal-dependent hydrolase [Armatimonas rosea]
MARLTLETLPIIDTHQHLWDFTKFQPPWLKTEPKLNHSMTLKDYAKATAGLNVVKTVYMEVDVAPKQQVAEAKYVAGLSASRKTVMAAGVVSCRPALPGFAAYAKMLAKSPYHPYIKGLRQVLQVPDAPRGLCLQPTYVKNIQLLGELGLSFDICIRPTELSDAAKLVDKCPKTRFILDHCGNGMAANPNQAQWERDIKELAKRPNIVCKVSGIVKTVKPGMNAVEALTPVIVPTLDAFGPDRVMFGGDWPVCNIATTFRGWVETLREIVKDRPEDEQRKLFHDNAEAFYGLKK